MMAGYKDIIRMLIEHKGSTEPGTAYQAVGTDIQRMHDAWLQLGNEMGISDTAVIEPYGDPRYEVFRQYVRETGFEHNGTWYVSLAPLRSYVTRYVREQDLVHTAGNPGQLRLRGVDIPGSMSHKYRKSRFYMVSPQVKIW